MEDKILNFERPTQVAFWDYESNQYIGGIAYGAEIICGCCGGVVEIAEVYEFVPENVKPIIVYDDWEVFSNFIIKDEERYFEFDDVEWEVID